MTFYSTFMFLGFARWLAIALSELLSFARGSAVSAKS
jgi:hypothetical protein